MDNLTKKEVDDLSYIGSEKEGCISRASREYAVLKEQLKEKKGSAYKVLIKREISKGDREFQAGYVAALEDFDSWIDENSH